jgi:hypothetical protein
MRGFAPATVRRLACFVRRRDSQLVDLEDFAMAENKTKASEGSVENYIAAIDDETRRKDCEGLVQLLSEATKHPPKMWGSSIVGFGSYHYKYESGREGDMCLVGFSSRKGDISVYGLASSHEHDVLLSKLGKHKMGTAKLTKRYSRSLRLDPSLKECANMASAKAAPNPSLNTDVLCAALRTRNGPPISLFRQVS